MVWVIIIKNISFVEKHDTFLGGWSSGKTESKLDLICAKGTEINLIFRDTPSLVDFLYLQENYKSIFFSKPESM